MPFLSPGVPTVESCKPAYKGKTPGEVGEEGAPERLETETRCFYATISWIDVLLYKHPVVFVIPR